MDINVPMYSCWYSFIRHKDKYIGFGRSQVTGDWTVRHPLNYAELDTNTWTLASCTTTNIIGEDPRIFHHKGDLYFVDNYVNSVKLFNYDKKTVVPIHLPGKNFTWISRDDKLYAIYTMLPLVMVEVNPETGVIKKFHAEEGNSDYILYRGGTPGYKLGETTYYGFGHMTYAQAVPGHPSSYDPFLWIFDFATKKIRIVAMDKPSPSRVIQPTCVIDDKYLVTAESMDLWGGPTTPENWKSNGYATRVYKLSDEITNTIHVIGGHSVMTPK